MATPDTPAERKAIDLDPSSAVTGTTHHYATGTILRQEGIVDRTCACRD